MACLDSATGTGRGSLSGTDGRVLSRTTAAIELDDYFGEREGCDAGGDEGAGRDGAGAGAGEGAGGGALCRGCGAGWDWRQLAGGSGRCTGCGRGCCCTGG